MVTLYLGVLESFMCAGEGFFNGTWLCFNFAYSLSCAIFGAKVWVPMPMIRVCAS